MKPPIDPNLGGQSANFFPDRVAEPEVTVVQYLQDEPGRENNPNFRQCDGWLKITICFMIVQLGNNHYDLGGWIEPC